MDRYLGLWNSAQFIGVLLILAKKVIVAGMKWLAGDACRGGGHGEMAWAAQQVHLLRCSRIPVWLSPFGGLQPSPSPVIPPRLLHCRHWMWWTWLMQRSYLPPSAAATHPVSVSEEVRSLWTVEVSLCVTVNDLYLVGRRGRSRGKAPGMISSVHWPPWGFSTVSQDSGVAQGCWDFVVIVIY